MYYATIEKAKDIGLKVVFGAETHVIKFYTKADRAAYISKHQGAQAITAGQAKAMKAPWGFGYTVSDKELDCVYFGCIV